MMLPIIAMSTPYSARWLISTGGAGAPLWTSNSELVYIDNGSRGLVAARLQLGTTGRVLERVTLFSWASYLNSNSTPEYDVSRDGRHFLAVKSSKGAGDVAPIVVLRWFDEIKRRMAAQGGRPQ